jgi:hypothetical protein
MNTIRDFPFDPIAKDLREGKCIPFLGAGASSFPIDIEAKPPSARALAWELAKEWNHPQYQVFCDTANSNDPGGAGAFPAGKNRLRKSDARQFLGRARPGRSAPLG